MSTTAQYHSIAEEQGFEILYSEKNIEIGYNMQYGYLHCNWIGYQNKDSIMKAGEKILECLMGKQVTKVLNDNTLVNGPWHEAAEWTVTNWFPRMEKAGMQHFAWVFSPNIFSELSAKKAMPANNIVRSFAGTSPAKEWLISGN